MALSAVDKWHVALESAADFEAVADEILTKLDGQDRPLWLVGWSPEPFRVDSAIGFYRRQKEKAAARSAELRARMPAGGDPNFMPRMLPHASLPATICESRVTVTR